MTGLKRRHIANLARAGQIPGATRPDGYHFQYRLTPKLRDWIKETCRRVKESRLPKAPKPSRKDQNHGILSLHGIGMELEVWLRRVGKGELKNGLKELAKKPDDQRKMLAEQVKLAVDIYEALTKRIAPASKDRR